MSRTLSSVVKPSRAGPISSAHCSNRCDTEPPVKRSTAWHPSGSEVPVPRWSKTSRSRLRSAGAIASAMNSLSGSAAWPGPPARPTTALVAGCGPASLRLTLREIEPETAPERVSGTGSEAHEKVLDSGQGVKVSVAAEAGWAASAATTSAPHRSPAGIVRMARQRMPDDDSGRARPGRPASTT